MTADPLDRFHPLVSRWFRGRFGAPTEPQVRGWPSIIEGRDTLIAAPTGSGKTLAAFLACLDGLIRRGLEAHHLPDRTRVLYISPLKALSNDIHRNLTLPLEELAGEAESAGLPLPPIRAAVRTGDTPPAERQRMAKRPPHVLVTTPESLFILLTAERSRQALSSVETVIVDEIHAVAGDKRGAHLALSLERLDRLVRQTTGNRPVRIGLSATQRPIEDIGRLLVGTARPAPTIVDGGHAREIDLALEATDDELGAIATHEQMDRVYDRIAELVRAHDTTLVFVNTRRMVERVAHALESRIGEDAVVAHHGSLSREIRFAAEQKLKHGRVRCAVATASLELGIDVGTVDLVVQIGSPRSIATLLQRVGRSGHSLGATPKGRLFALTRDQLLECAALVRAVQAGRLDAISLRDAPLDILAQQITAMAACEDLDEDALFEAVRGATPYAHLAREDFEQVLTMLAEGLSDRRGRRMAHLHRDRIGRRVRGRRGARLAALTSGGAIPDNANYRVVTHPDEVRVGDLDEDFAIESNAGDVFLLGNTSWRIRRVESGRVLVEDAKGASPTVPFWLGEAPARTEELSEEVSDLRAEVEARLERCEPPDTISTWLSEAARAPRSLAEQAVAYLVAGRAALGVLPTRTRVVAERFFDEAGGMQLVLHAPFGGRINRAWGLALRKRFCRSFDFELQAAATDDGIVISLGEPHSFPLGEVARFLASSTAREVLTQATLASPAWEVRWRWNATRALQVLRRRGGKKVPPNLLRMRADDLLSVVFPLAQACLENVVGDIELPDHPLVRETMRDCLTEAMDADGFQAVVEKLERGEIQFVAVDTVEPSPLSHELIHANPYAFLDGAPLEERRTRAVSLRRGLSPTVADDLGALDPKAVATAEAEAAPVIRDADELHDALTSLYLLPATDVEPHRAWLDALLRAGRATAVVIGGVRSFVAAERLPLVEAAVPGCAPEPALPPLPFAVEVPDRESALRRIVHARLDHAGPRRASEIASALGLPRDEVHGALLALEADGAILRGRFTDVSHAAGQHGSAARDDEVQWCERRILARIHRLTLHDLRQRIEPVSPAALMRFLFRWQGVDPGHRRVGPEGLGRAIAQLAGFESAAGAWEREILPARLHAYDPTWLDHLCLAGQVAWCRLAGRPTGPHGRVTPTRAAPLALMLREDVPWLRAAGRAHDADGLSRFAASVQTHLESRGASFVGEIVQGTGLRPEDAEEGLWELVAAGRASADGFAALRTLIGAAADASPNAHRWRRRGGGPGLPAAAGRWSLLPAADPSALDPEAHARLLLERYGVVFHDLLSRESSLPAWRELLLVLRRLEARGDVRGGRFVSGFVGEQFALPEAVEGLRAVRKEPLGEELVRVGGTDPLNLVGITSPGPRVPALVGNAVLYRNGTPVASREGGHVVLRGALPPGAQIDADLRYRAATPSVGDAPSAEPSFAGTSSMRTVSGASAGE